MEKKVLILLSNGFEVMEAAPFTEVFGWASIYGDTHFEQLSVGLRSPVRTTFGFDVLPESLLDEINPDEFDALVIPGGFGDAGFYEESLSALFSMSSAASIGARPQSPPFVSAPFRSGPPGC